MIAPATVPEEIVTVDKAVADRMDTNKDGHISRAEMELDLEFKRKEYEDADAMRDAQRNMAWFALLGMLVLRSPGCGLNCVGS